MFEKVEVQVALISSLTTVTILGISAIVKFFYNKYALNYRLKREYEYEQKKKIQNELGRYKGKLLNSAEELNHRLWNFSLKREDGWHIVSSNDYTNPSKYYFQSFIYRLLVFFYWANKIEKETEYVDTTIASKHEANFLMYLKNLKLMFCDVLLLKGMNYDTKNSTDHFFKHEFEKTLSLIEDNDDVLSYDKFLEKFTANISEYEKWTGYISNIHKTSKSCLKWNVVVSFHLLLLCFLNDYGYEFQKTKKDKMVTIIEKYSGFVVKENLLEMIKRKRMEKVRGVKGMLKLL